MNEIYLNLFKTISITVFLLLVGFVIEYLLVKKVKDKRKSLKYRVLNRYVLFFCFFFFMAKVWVEGFGYLLTFVGVISAALTITQKEYLMNFFGWLIIMWRDLFEEGDFIEIGQYSGYVKRIRPLYFLIDESSEWSWGRKTGRTVKIPNGLIANNPLVNFSAENTFVQGKLIYTFDIGSSVDKLKTLISKLEAEIASMLLLQKAYATLARKSRMKPQGSLRIFQTVPAGIQLRVEYMSLRQNQKDIEDKAFDIVIQMLRENPDLFLTLGT